MIARVADHLFWLGRYLERAECTARMLLVTEHLALDADLPPADVWRPVIIVSGEEADATARLGPDAAGDAERVLDYFTWDEANPVAVKRSVAAARWNARAVREVVSLEVWQTVNELHVWLDSAAARAAYATSRYDFYRRVIRGVQLALGQLQSTMLHDDALDFVFLGLLLERVGQTARTVDVHHHTLAALDPATPDAPALATVLWLALLRACSGLEAFFKRLRGPLNGTSVARFLVLERDLPRSVRFGVAEAGATLARILARGPDAAPGQASLAALRAVDDALAATAPEALAAGAHPGLHAVLTAAIDGVADVCDRLAVELFGHAPAPAPAPPGELPA